MTGGNLVDDGSRRFHYDAMNRLVRVSDGGGDIATYAYDGLNRRIRKDAGGDVTAFFYDAAQVIEERNGVNQTQRQFVYGRRIDSPLQIRTGGQDYYYHDNSLGSIVALTDDTAAVVERYEYDVFGATRVLAADGASEIPASIVDNPYRFTGRRFDGETGLYYYRARYYEPEQGTFPAARPPRIRNRSWVSTPTWTTTRSTSSTRWASRRTAGTGSTGSRPGSTWWVSSPAWARWQISPMPPSTRPVATT